MIELLGTCLESDKNQFIPQLSAVSAMLARASTDTNPEMKQKVANFSGTISRELRNNVGVHLKGVVIGLTANLAH